MTDIRIKDKIWKDLQDIPSPHNEWSPLEDEILLEFYRIKTTEGIVKVMNKHGFKRTGKAIRVRSEALKHRGLKFKYMEHPMGDHGRT